MKEEKKKFRDTKVGGWLRKHAPSILAGVSDLTPDAGLLNVVAKAIQGEEIDPKDRLEFQRLLEEAEAAAQEQVTRRWEADAKTSFWLPNNIRPLTLAVLLVAILAFITADGIEGLGFTLGEGHLDLLQYLAMTVFGAYFAARSWDKTKQS